MAAPFQPAAPGPLRLGVFVTHPIQYSAPVWRGLAATPGLDVTVHFFSDHGVRSAKDTAFGVNVAWDVPLLEGYRHVFLSRDANLRRKREIALPDAATRVTRAHFDAVLVHSYFGRFERQVLSAARANGVATVIYADFTDSGEKQRPWLKACLRDFFLRRLYRHVDRFCYTGQVARRHLERLGIGANRLFRAPLTVDTALFEKQRAQWPRNAARAALGFAEDDLVVLFSGKFVPGKAPLVLLEAISRLRGRDRVVLLMLGDGELRPVVEQKGRELGVRLRLEGFVNQSALGQRYAAADVMALPSRSETWGLVVNEAMQFDLPVIATTKVGCHEDLILEGKTGMVFPVDDVAALATCLQKLVDQPGLTREMGAAARAHIAGYTTEAAVNGIRRALGVG